MVEDTKPEGASAEDVKTEPEASAEVETEAEKTVPYTRFSEVIGERNEARDEIEMLKQRIDELEAKEAEPEDIYLDPDEQIKKLLERQDKLERQWEESQKRAFDEKLSQFEENHPMTKEEITKWADCVAKGGMTWEGAYREATLDRRIQEELKKAKGEQETLDKAGTLKGGASETNLSEKPTAEMTRAEFDEYVQRKVLEELGEK